MSTRACHLPRRLVKVSSRFEGSALGTESLETLPNQSLLKCRYWCSMAVPGCRMTTSNPLGSSPIPDVRSSSTTSWGVATPTSRMTRRCGPSRSEEHTSELQSRQYLVCRLLLEKKKKKQQIIKLLQ